MAELVNLHLIRKRANASKMEETPGPIASRTAGPSIFANNKRRKE